MLKKFILNSAMFKFLGFLLGFFVFIPNMIKPYLVILVILLSVFSYSKREKPNNFLKNVLPIILLFILYLISLFNSSNIHLGLTLVGRMTPLFILPIAFFYMDEIKRKCLYDSFKKYFILALTLYSICIFIYLNSLGCFSGDSSFEYGYSYVTNEFYMINDHPIYISSYFSVGLLLILYSPFKSKVLSVFTFIIIFSGLIVLSRKGSIIAFLICALSYFLSNKKSLVKGFTFLIIISIIFVSFSEIKNRFLEVITKNKIEKNPETSTGIRIIVWENAFNIAFNNNFLGYGAGDVQSVLNAKYLEQGYKRIADGNFNAHNQFLQVGLTVGYLGLIVFAGSLVFMIYNFGIKKDKKSISIVVLFILILFTESYLERQNGIFFFSLIISMLTFVDHEKENFNNRSISPANFRS